MHLTPDVRLPDARARDDSRLGRLGMLAEGFGWRDALSIAVPAAVMGALSILNLGAHSFWRDEVSSVVFSAAPLGDLLAVVGRKRSEVGLANMAAYYVLLHFWLMVGETEARVRLLSVIAGVLAVVPVYFVGRRIGGAVAGAFGAGIYALSTYAIQWNQEARGYSLSVLITAALTWILLLAVERRAIRYWLGYGLLAAVGLYVHFFIALVVAAHGIWLLATRQVPRLGALLAAVIPVAVAAVPIPLVALKYGGGHLWIGGVTIRHVMSVLEALTGGLPILLAMIALVVYTLIAQRHKPVLWLAAGTLLFPITATILVSLFKPLLVTRYLVICLPAMAIVAGVALAAIRASAVRWAAVLAVGGLLVAALPQTYADTHQQDWRSAGRWIAHETRAGDQLVIGSWGRRPIEYYINRRHPAVAPDRVALQTATDGGADRVWLVLTNLSAEQRESQINALSGQYEVQEERIFGAKVHVVLMTSRRPAAGAG